MRLSYIGERSGEKSDGQMVTQNINVIGMREEAGLGDEIILLNCCKWLQINNIFFTVRILWFSGSP